MIPALYLEHLQWDPKWSLHICRVGIEVSISIYENSSNTSKKSSNIRIDCMDLKVGPSLILSGKKPTYVEMPTQQRLFVVFFSCFWTHPCGNAASLFGFSCSFPFFFFFFNYWETNSRYSFLVFINNHNTPTKWIIFCNILVTIFTDYTIKISHHRKYSFRDLNIFLRSLNDTLKLAMGVPK